MKVSIGDLGVNMDIKSAGMELKVWSADGKKHLGDLVVSNTKLRWYPGKSHKNCHEVTWDEFIAYVSGLSKTKP